MRSFLRATTLAALLALVAPQQALASKERVAVSLVQQHIDDGSTRHELIDALKRALDTTKPIRDRLELELYLSEQYRLEGRLEEATSGFVRVANHGKAGNLVPAAQLGLTLAAIAQRGYTESDFQALQSLQSRQAPPSLEAFRHLELARVAHTNSDEDAFRAHSSKALVYAVTHPAIETTVANQLQTLRAANDKEGDEYARILDKADLALHRGDNDVALDIATSLMNQAEPGERVYRAAKGLQKRAQGSTPKPLLVLMLPLEDARYSAVARQLQDAFEYGYQTTDEAWDIAVVDSGSDAESMAEAVENAVLERGASVLVGPLLTGQAVPAAEAAEALRTPLLSLSKGIADASEYRFVFQMSTTLEDEVNALVTHAIDVEGMKSFAAFAPQTPYGERAVGLFVEAAEQRQGQVTVIDFYDPTTTDLLVDAQELGRKDYDLRREEFREIKKAIEEEGGDPNKAVLPPIIDFDAIFLPERASRIPLACAALAYEEFPMGDFRPIPDSPAIPLLGLSGWNQSKLTQSGGPYVRGSRFVDIFARPSKDGRWSFSEGEAALVDGYKEAYGRTISSLEAAALDVGMLVSRALMKLTPNTSPKQVRDAIAAQRMDDALTGLSGIDPETHHGTRTLRILTMDSVEIYPAPVPERDRGQDSNDD